MKVQKSRLEPIPNDILLDISRDNSFHAIWIASLILMIPIIVAIRYFSMIAFLFLALTFFILYLFLVRHLQKESTKVHLLTDGIRIGDWKADYNLIEKFWFVGYHGDKKLVIDPLWWTPRTILLHFKLKSGETKHVMIPNKFSNAKEIERAIRRILSNKGVTEAKEVMR